MDKFPNLRALNSLATPVFHDGTLGEHKVAVYRARKYRGTDLRIFYAFFSPIKWQNNANGVRDPAPPNSSLLYAMVKLHSGGLMATSAHRSPQRRKSFEKKFLFNFSSSFLHNSPLFWGCWTH